MKTTSLFRPQANSLAEDCNNYLQPKSALTHLSLTNPHGAHFRSKILSAHCGINPLVTAASALLVFITRLPALQGHPDFPELYATLLHEVKAFEIQAQKKKYRAEHILVARYLLCATLDEVLLNTANKINADWHPYQLLHYFHGEEWSGERFFLILDRLRAAPREHIDLLELIYLCLSLGFSGKYRQAENGKSELEGLRDQLYDVIRTQRGEVSKALSKPDKPIEAVATAGARLLPLWIMLSFTGFLLLTVYCGFNFMLASNLSPLSQALNNIVQSHTDD